jgi:hypothetical protein
MVFFLQVRDVPWLKEKGEFSVRGNLVYAGGEAVAIIRRPRR